MRSSVVGASAPAYPLPHAARILLEIVNADRAAAGLHPLVFDSREAGVALGHSLDMAAGSYFSHLGRDGSSPFARIDRAGIGYHIAGENIGYEAGAGHTAMLRAIDAAMLRSPGHRANLLRQSFTHVGIGVAVRGDTLYVTEDFTG